MPRSPSHLKRFRHKLADIDALPQLALLGLFSGSVTALIIVLFRELIFRLSTLFTGSANDSVFLSLPWQLRLLLPLAGMILVIAISALSHRKHHRIGIVHVIERLTWHQGRFYPGSFLHQFFAGALVLATGHSIGREGPAVHLGAASASMLGRYLHLPNDNLRVLVACGSAAAISATFNTPVAGVIFAMEVLLIEYTVTRFLPVLLASACAATLTQFIYGSDQAFIVPPLTINPVDELPLVIIIGITMGLLGTLFCRAIIVSNRRVIHLPPAARLMLAALITGLLAIPAPAIMGSGYNTITTMMVDFHPTLFLLILLGCKFIASVTSIGLGVPGGLIGPTMFIGAAGGALVTSLVDTIPWLESGSAGFHVMVGMSAMLGAVMQSPLTALVTVVEMTRNPELLFPALVAIVIATLIARLLMKQKGIFEQILDTWRS